MLPSSKFGNKTKPKRSSSAVRPLFLCKPYCNNSIVKGNFKNIVQLPKYVDTNEWLAVNGKNYCPRLIIDLRSPNSHPNANPTFFLFLSYLVFDFYNYINMFYSSISDFCSVRDCPTMSAGEG